MRLINADAIVDNLKKQMVEMLTNAEKKVNPDDYYIKRNQAYMDTVTKSMCDSFIRFLQAQPTIEVETVRHGMWVDFVDNDGYEYECNQPNCGCRISWDGANTDFRFCPNCGAKMDLEEGAENA